MSASGDPSPASGAQQAFDDVCIALVGLPVAHLWRGHGSAIFLEIGALSPTTLRNGKPGNPDGTFSLMIEWSWRIEDSASIVCGSWSEEELWQPAFDRILGAKVTGMELFGRLPEVAVSLSNSLHVVSLATAEGQPAWTLFDRRGGGVVTFSSARGAVVRS